MESWLFPSSIEEAKTKQESLAKQVILEDSFGPVEFIAGMDVSNNLYDPAQMIYAAIVVLSFPSLEVVERHFTAEKQVFPYVPGLLGFREAPALIHAFQGLKRKPDLIMVDGHGVSHPRGLGIASHIGVLLDVPTIGVAKSVLVGKPKSLLSNTPGAENPLVWKGKEIATFLRTKLRANPLIISPGHKVSPEAAVQWVQKCLKGYRLPEPTRLAHLAANECRKSFKWGIGPQALKKPEGAN